MEDDLKMTVSIWKIIRRTGPWGAGPEEETRAVFVDEATCIGCKLCALNAPNTFEMVDDFAAGRARCTRQWGDDELTTQIAIEMCPVDCIYWVKRGMGLTENKHSTDVAWTS